MYYIIFILINICLVFQAGALEDGADLYDTVKTRHRDSSKNLKSFNHKGWVGRNSTEKRKEAFGDEEEDLYDRLKRKARHSFTSKSSLKERPQRGPNEPLDVCIVEASETRMKTSKGVQLAEKEGKEKATLSLKKTGLEIKGKRADLSEEESVFCDTSSIFTSSESETSDDESAQEKAKRESPHYKRMKEFLSDLEQESFIKSALKSLAFDIKDKTKTKSFIVGKFEEMVSQNLRISDPTYDPQENPRKFSEAREGYKKIRGLYKKYNLLSFLE